MYVGNSPQSNYVVTYLLTFGGGGANCGKYIPTYVQGRWKMGALAWSTL